MSFITLSGLIAIVGIVLGLLGVFLRINEIFRRPFKRDLSRPRGQRWRGVLYAFTLGMAPWEKESTRKHWVAYLRGIFFHVGVFMAIVVLLASPWLELFPVWSKWIAVAVTASGFLFSLMGIPMRLMGENERALSLPDDYFAVLLTSLFIGLAGLMLLLPAARPYFYIVSGITAAYIPLGKIRHCIYFFYAKFFFGLGFGHRGVLGQSKSGNFN